ncbi:MAG: spore maturation protein A [Oscillospiraceae bacterium]|nr:spore maturation protein A [Oscillospiraceae bacterium]
MALAGIWTGMVCLALLFGSICGNGAAVGAAAMEGAAAAVELCLALAGPLLLWSALGELLRASGLAAGLARCLRPVLFRLYPSAREDPLLAEDLSCNLSANLLGLGNAATPPGIRAATRLRALSGSGDASDELCRLAVMNTASVQLLPLTVASLRAALGAAAPFDILPAVWLASLVSVTAGLLAERCLRVFS